MKKVALFDTSTIVTWINLSKYTDLFELLPNIAEYALIPQKVVEELQNYQAQGEQLQLTQRFLDRISDENGFFRLCTALDAVVYEQIVQLPKVDNGEAETLAQNSVIQSDWILIDDKQCIYPLTKTFPQVHFHNSIVVLALLAQTQLLPDADTAFNNLNRVYNFTDRQKKQALQQAKEWLQI
jgi:predicted nucleic acid-binding protein